MQIAISSRNIKCRDFTTFFSLICSTYLLLDRSLVKSIIIVKPVDTEVKLGESAYLNCSTSSELDEISWYHYPVGGNTGNYGKYVYTSGSVFVPYDKRFKVERNAFTGSFRLVITSVDLEDAGLYVCQNDRKAEDAGQAELIVLKSPPVCRSNIDDLGLIGPNNCGLKQDNIYLSCIVDYKGNIPPEIQFQEINNENVVNIYKPQTGLACNASDGAIQCSFSSHTSVDLDKSKLICRTTRSSRAKYSCTTDYVNIHYAVPHNVPLTRKVGDVVACLANTSPTFCSYSWIWFDGAAQEPVSDNEFLTLNKAGWHKCLANCSIKHQWCNFESVMVLASQEVGDVAESKQTDDMVSRKTLSQSFIVGFTIIIIMGIILGFVLTIIQRIISSRPTQPKFGKGIRKRKTPDNEN